MLSWIKAPQIGARLIIEHLRYVTPIYGFENKYKNQSSLSKKNRVALKEMLLFCQSVKRISKIEKRSSFDNKAILFEPVLVLN